MAGAVMAMLLIAVVGVSRTSVTAAEASSRRDGPAGPGDFAGLVELPDGRQLYLECRGEGAPTVILEAGGGLAADLWSELEPGVAGPAVLPAVAEFTRVCAYDRPGTTQASGEPSRSGALEGRRSFAAIVDELHELLEAAELPGPYVLVGYSMGGGLLRMFAGTYPDEVVGFVSIDAAHELIYDAFQRLIGPPAYDLPEAETDLPATQQEMVEFWPGHPLHQMPMVVVEHSRDRQQVPSPLGWPPDWPIAEMEQSWQAAQDDIAALVPGTAHWIAWRSGHNLTTNQPDLVIDAVRAVVDAVRRGDLQLASGDLPRTGGWTWVLIVSAAAITLIGGGLRLTARAAGRSPNS
jgi:pimeloyl-ACP methyl ester carboxylesterase